MKVVFTLLAFAGSLQLMSGFAFVAAGMQRAGSVNADVVGFTGVGISAVAFLVASVFIWRAA